MLFLSLLIAHWDVTPELVFSLYILAEIHVYRLISINQEMSMFSSPVNKFQRVIKCNCKVYLVALFSVI